MWPQSSSEIFDTVMIKWLSQHIGGVFADPDQALLGNEARG